MKVKVKDASKLPHHKHDLNHDVSTTFDWGHIQPLMVRELPARSSCNLRVGQIVRLQNLVLPTFGRLTLNTYNVFVPMESIFHPYASLRAGQTYMGSNATYIPNQVISCSPAFIDLIVKCFSEVSILICPVANLSYNTDTLSVEFDYCTNVSDVESWYDFLVQSYPDFFSSGVAGTPFTTDYFSDYVQFKRQEVPESFDSFDWVQVANDTFHSSEEVQFKYIVCGRYTEAGRNLRKVLYGCGYKLIFDFTPVSILPILAYYKAYYDLFYPKRDMTWKDTPAAGLQEWCEQYGNFGIDTYQQGYAYVNKQRFVRFFLDLCETYYTQSPDFVSAHISGQRISTVPNQGIVSMDASGIVTTHVQTGNNPGTGVSIGSTNTSTTPVYTRLLNQSNIDILERLTHRINAATQIGGDIRAFLKTQLGADYLDEDETYWIGSSKLDINISPVFSNAETESGYLGEFAAQGSGANRGDLFKYETKVDGYWVTLAAVVPDARYAQGMDMNLKHVRRQDFLDPAFDSLTLLPTSKKYIFAERNFLNLIVTEDLDYGAEEETSLNSSFGNIPNYMEYCIAQNIQNGDMSLRRYRESYLPYTLDKLLPYTSSYRNEEIDRAYIRNTSYNVIVNSTIWRYIGLYKWIGDLNRVFANRGQVPAASSEQRSPENIYTTIGYEDNFISHNVLDFQVWNYKLPVRDSFQTGAFDEGAISLEKA